MRDLIPLNVFVIGLFLLSLVYGQTITYMWIGPTSLPEKYK